MYPPSESPAKGAGLREAFAVWALFGTIALAILVTYSWLPAHERYHVDTDGLAGGAGRALVFLAFPTALVAIPIVLLVARSRILAAIGIVLCATVAWPGNVDEADLDAKPLNALTAAGVGLAFALTLDALRRGGFGQAGRVAGDRIRLWVAALLLLASVPWILAEVGLYVDDVPLFRLPFMSDEPSPVPGGPTAVHLGHHHGFDGVLLALAALLLTRPVQRIRRSTRRSVLAVYLSLLLVYGLGNALQDFWLEQLVKRGWLNWEIPQMIRPDFEPVWAVIIVFGLAAYAALWRRASSR